MGVCPIFGILTCVHREHFCPPSTSAQNWAHLSWLDQSKRPHLNLCRDRCVLFGTGSCMAILSAQCRLSWPIELDFQFESWSQNPTQIRQIYVYSLRGVMEICRFSTQPKANALIDCIYYRQALCWLVSIPCYTPAGSRHRRAVATHFST